MFPLILIVPVLSLVNVLLAVPVINPVIDKLVPVDTPAFKLFEINASAVVPVKDKVPASTFILALLVKLIVPVKAFVPSIFLIAPSELIPIPEMKIGPAAKLKLPSNCNALPELIVVVPAAVPSAFAFVLIFKIPAAVVVEVPTEMLPVYPLLSPLKVNIVLAPPSFTIALAPFILPVTETFPKAPPIFNAPVSSNALVLFVNVNVPASTLILAAELIVTKLDNVFDPLGFLMAPVAFIPVPVMKIGSGIVYPVPLIFNAAPVTTVVLDAAVLLAPGELLPNPS